MALSERAQRLIEELAEELKACSGGEIKFQSYALAKYDKATGEPKPFRESITTKKYGANRHDMFDCLREDNDENAYYELQGRRQFVLGVERIELEGGEVKRT